MRHHKDRRIFGRDKGQRVALLRSLALALIEHGKIETTQEKAKELRPYIEPLITRAKSDTLTVKRYLLSHLGSGGHEAVKKLTGTIGPKYKTRNGGYTRVTKVDVRGSDGAAMARIEFV
jgi:large subunit ribosomal protein L17